MNVLLFDPAIPDMLRPVNSFTDNFKSLRGNAVLRWEYLPGSTLYLVWAQSRSDYEQMGDFQFNRSFRRLWTADVDNIFMIKMAYWLNL